ncbi:hypothetical protein ABBQ38_007975 [Trebouxia sp. C0009 RCD-2024]
MARSIKLESFGLPRSLSTGTCLLLTGIGAFGLGWLSSVFVPFPYGRSSSADGSPPSGNQDQEAYQESEFDQENGSEMNTPRSSVRRTSPRRTNTGLNFSSRSHLGAQFKQVILIRTDLDMGVGRTAAQSCHAAVVAVKKAWKSKSPAYKAWESAGAIKVCLAVDNEEVLLAIRDQARRAGLPTAVVLDDELAQPARTVLAIGPGASIDIDSITSQLRLYDQAE